MEWLKNGAKDRERQRYYLLAGMGGRPARRKHRRFLLLSVSAAVFVSLALCGLFVWLWMRH